MFLLMKYVYKSSKINFLTELVYVHYIKFKNIKNISKSKTLHKNQ
jgi:hypothetical protein